ncbi:hypothetical protein Y032_0010g1084 [Ancylostoma ceylanicum]|uniref:Uncharacterized protein n=1 Tax=Ancylostoma ceylanicum TaxID=53326 RepID=A0A016VG86_9BILA|nr:hypothetical protein Y032_0010g1084 [Ancylostoma ceylanicum]
MKFSRNLRDVSKAETRCNHSQPQCSRVRSSTSNVTCERGGNRWKSKSISRASASCKPQGRGDLTHSQFHSKAR